MNAALVRRALPSAVFLALVCVGTGDLGHAQTPSAPPGVGIASVRATTRARRVLTGAWVGTRVREAAPDLDPSCYRPALVRRPTMAGELRVRARLDATGRLTRVTATRVRGSVSTAVARCVRAAFTNSTLAMTPLPRPPEELEIGAQYVESERDPPSARDLPVTLEIRITFTAPPAEPEQSPTPDPTPPPQECRGPNPAGCRSRGCPGGMRCDTSVGCVPSSCGCNSSNGAYICTTDCGGGTCVPNR